MISKQYLFTVLFIIAALCVILSHSSPVPSEEVATNSRRQGRFYGLGGSNAMAFASANAGGYGYPGFGYGGSTAMASASASAGAGGFGMYGK